MNARRQYHDDLRPARGILTAIILSIVLWALVLWAIPAAFADGPTWLPMLDHWRAEAGVGVSRYGTNGDNIWYDQTYPHHNNLDSAGIVLGVAGDFTHRFGWRVWGMDFGRVSNDAVWPPDSDYFAKDGAAPTYQGRGTGHAYGISAGPTVNFYPAPHWRATLEAGLLFYRSNWSEQVRPIAGGAWQDASTFAPGMGWQNRATGYAGIGFSYRRMFVAYRKYRDVSGFDSLFGAALKQVIVGATIPF